MAGASQCVTSSLPKMDRPAAASSGVHGPNMSRSVLSLTSLDAMTGTSVESCSTST